MLLVFVETKLKGYFMAKKIYIWIIIGFLVPVSLGAASPAPEWTLKVSTEECPVYQKAGKDNPVLLNLPAGTEISSFKKTGEWYRVILGPDSQGFFFIGYVFSQDVETVINDTVEKTEIWRDKPQFYKEMGFTVRFVAGVNLISKGEMRKGVDGLRSTVTEGAESMGVLSEFQDRNMGSVFELGGDLLYNITPRLALGLGASHMQGGEIDTVRFKSQENRPAGQVDTDFRFTTVPLKFILKYTTPLSRLFNLSLTGVPTLYFSKVKYALMNPYYNLDNYQIFADSKSLGFTAAVGIEFKMAPNAVFYLEGIGRYANLSSFKGKQTTYGDINPSASYSYKLEGTVYYFIKNSQPGLIVSAETPSGYDSVKKAVFNFSGLSIRAGVSVRF